MAFFSATLFGVQPIRVEIEIDLSDGMPFFQIVGLPDAVLKESRTRVKSAILQAGFDFPYDKRVVLNLAPSEIKKEGSSFELGLAARILASSDQITVPEGNTLFLGELALDGTVRAVPEMRALAYACTTKDLLVAPRVCLEELKGVPCRVVGIDKLQDLTVPRWWELETPAVEKAEAEGNESASLEDFRQRTFSAYWARLLEIAAHGGHHVFLCGPPGCGKTYFADSLKLLVEGLRASEERPREIRILDALFRRGSEEIPWAAPHHSSTAVGLIGGGGFPQPGAVTRAHGGILFLDELLEFKGSVLDSLREPMERGEVEIQRAGYAIRFPSRFQLIGAANPCRCGYWKCDIKECHCREWQVRDHQNKMSGPLFDRFEIRVRCELSWNHEELVKGSEIFSRVVAAREKTAGEIPWSANAEQEHGARVRAGKLSFRASRNVRRVAETIARLDATESVKIYHVNEAFDFNRLFSQ